MSDHLSAQSKGRDRRSPEAWLYDLLGKRDHPDDMTGPPMDGRKFYWGEPHDVCPRDQVAAQTEDGAELWFGHVDEWRFHMPLKTARRMALWLIWNWIKDLGGLRTWAWYRLLHRKVNRWPGRRAEA